MADYYLSTGTQNVTTIRYNNPAADVIARQLAVATSQSEKVKLHHQLADLVLKDVPNTFITLYESTQIYDKTLQGYTNYFDQRPLLDEMCRTIPFAELPGVFDDFIQAQIARRVVVDVNR